MPKRPACVDLIFGASQRIRASFSASSGAVAGCSARPRGSARARCAAWYGMKISWVHANAGEHDKAFSCPEHILLEYLSAYILCCGMYVQPVSMESESSYERARGVGIKDSDVLYLSHICHALVRCVMPVAVQIFEEGEVISSL